MVPFSVGAIYREKYQPRGAGGPHSLPATPHRLQNPKWLIASLPEMRLQDTWIFWPRLSNFDFDFDGVKRNDGLLNLLSKYQTFQNLK